MAGLFDILAADLPAEKMHKRMGVTNPVAKSVLTPMTIAGILTAGVGAAGMYGAIKNNKAVRKQLASGWMPADVAEKTVLRGRTLGDIIHGPYHGAEFGSAAFKKPADGGVNTIAAMERQMEINRLQRAYDSIKFDIARASQMDSADDSYLYRQLDGISSALETLLAQPDPTIPATKAGFRKLSAMLRRSESGSIRDKEGRKLYSILGGQVVKDTGKPMPLHHGTKAAYELPSREAMDAPGNLWGPGYYTTASPDVASGYSQTSFAGKGVEGTSNVRTNFIDSRRPFDIDSVYTVKDVPELAQYVSRSVDRLGSVYVPGYGKMDVSGDLVRRAARRAAKDKYSVSHFKQKSEKLRRHKKSLNGNNLTEDDVQDLAGVIAEEEMRGKTPEDGSYVMDVEQAEYMEDEISRQEMVRDAYQSAIDIIEDAQDGGGGASYLNKFLDKQIEKADRELAIAGSRAAESARFNEAYKRAVALSSMAGPVSGADIYDNILRESEKGKLGVRDKLKQAGFDSIVHRGGRHRDALHHLVAIAFDPEQVYKPFVAGRKKSLIPSSSTTGLGAVLAAAGIGDQKRNAGGKELAML